ncbi:MAG TPA: iron-sulfur cluster assembly accessory protein, partial [Candidatus Diapherotrites archaeon]|nr:iron-sulfur cluster assembly accessory protein [Candidatus Diapherotrites archaeon]
MGSKEVITKNMLIGDVVNKYPKLAQTMMEHGLHCIGCHVNPYESIEAGAFGHGMGKETVEQMVGEMNEAVAGFEERDIVLSEAAVKKFSELMEKEGKAGWGLKFSVEPGGCSGYSYAMDFAKEPAENEKVLSEKGMKVFVDKNVFPMVKGVRIDFVDGLSGVGFKISNPNAQGTCGCGKSFH